MNDNLIINRVSIKRKGLETKTYLLPSITDLLTDGLIKKNHIDWLSVKLYLDGLYETKSAHDADINSINSRLITLSIDNEGNLEYSGYKFLNVINYNPTNTEDLTSRVTTLEGNVSSILGSINAINTTLQGLPSTYASKNHTHNFSELTGISEDNGYLNIGTEGNKFVEILPSKLIELSALATEGGNVYITPKIRSGEKAILIAEPNENKKFVKWTYNNLDISTNPIHILNNPLSAAAYIGVFTEADSDEPVQPTQYTVTISLPAHGSIVATANGANLGYGTFELNLGTIIHLEVSANTGYRFTNWSGVPTEKETLQSLDIAVNANTLISANFTILLYVVTVNTAKDENGTSVGTDVYPTIKINGVAQSNPVTVDYNTSVTLETVASIGNYNFQYWSDNHSKTNRVRTENIKSNLTSYPIYTRPTYEVIFGSNNTSYGTVTATYYGTSQSITSSTYVPKGSRLTFTANPKAGYEFVKWTENEQTVSQTPNYSFEVKATHSIVAVFAKIRCTIQTNATTGGTTSPAEQTVDYGTPVTVTASPETANGYKFTKWTKGTSNTSVSTNASYTFNATESITLKANFELNKYTVSASVDPAGSGTVKVNNVNNSTSVIHGQPATLVATANSGYTFANWTLNGTQVATTASYTIPAVTAPASYVAHFAEVDNTIYYFASENDDYSPTGKTVKTLGDNNTTEQLNNVDTLVFLVPTTITITKIEDAQMGTDFFNKFQTHAVTYNSQEYIAYYYTDPDAYINGQFIVRL